MKLNTLTPDEFADCGRALYGDRWQTALAQNLNVADRTLRRWLSGELQIPEGICAELRGLLNDRLQKIGGIIRYGINFDNNIILHYSTSAALHIEEGDTLRWLFDAMVPPEQRDLVFAGAEEALRQERERHPGVVGKFVFVG